MWVWATERLLSRLLWELDTKSIRKIEQQCMGWLSRRIIAWPLLDSWGGSSLLIYMCGAVCKRHRAVGLSESYDLRPTYSFHAAALDRWHQPFDQSDWPSRSHDGISLYISLYSWCIELSKSYSSFSIFSRNKHTYYLLLLYSSPVTNL